MNPGQRSAAKLLTKDEARRNRGEHRKAARTSDRWGCAMMARILRLALMALMAIASAVFIYGMIQEFNRLPPQSPTANEGNP
jgi:hypothetical protein